MAHSLKAGVTVVKLGEDGVDGKLIDANWNERLSIRAAWQELLGGRRPPTLSVNWTKELVRIGVFWGSVAG